jgi:hypothetical protein
MKKILATLFVITLIAACERDVTVNVPPQSTKLVLNSITRVNTQFRVSVGKTAGILDQTDANSFKVTNAFIQLYENNVLKDTLVYSASTDAYTVKRNTRPVTGNTYSIKASAPGFVTVEGETVTPQTTMIQSITKRANARKDADGNWLDEVKITFADDASTANYYLFKVKRPTFANGSVVNYNGIYCMHSYDKDIERGNNSDPTDFENCIDQEFFMTDKNFNGQTKEIILFIQHYQLDPYLNPTNNVYAKPIVELHSITYDHYKYRKSYDAYKDSEDNPFAEPVLVFSNVKNGYGIFSTYDLARDTIR